MSIPDPSELFTIGQLARRTGVPARTIRFWSDAGLVPPAARSASGYRLYNAAAVARLDLVRSLRELGLGLDVVRAIAARVTTVADVAAAHVAVLDGQIRTLRLRRAVLSTVARRGTTIEEASNWPNSSLTRTSGSASGPWLWPATRPPNRQPLTTRPSPSTPARL